MKRESKVALLLSGTVMATGIGLAVLPLMESALSRVMNRAEAAPVPPTVSDFPLPGGLTAAPMGMSRASVLPMLAFGGGSLTPADVPGRDAPRFAVLDLSLQPNGADFEPTGMNNHGDIVGNYRTMTPVEGPAPDTRNTPSAKRYRVTARPAIYRNGKIEALPAPTGYNWVCVSSVNDSGQAAGSARQLNDIPAQRVALIDMPAPRILRWDATGYTDLTPDFLRPPGAEGDLKMSRFIYSMADPVFVRNDGCIYAGFVNLYRWRSGDVTRFEAGFVRQVNERGTMIGAVPNRTAPNKGDLPMSGGPLGLPSVPLLQPGLVDTTTGKEFPLGRFSDEPCAINDAGVTILRGARNGGMTQFSLWRGEKAEPLATLPPCRSGFINNNGWVLLGDGMPEGARAVRDANPPLGPFLRVGGKHYWLQGLLESPRDWVLSNPVALNDRSQILIYAFKPGDSKRHALLLTPTG